MYPLFGGGGVLCWSLFWQALLYILSSFAIILLLLSFGCRVTVNVLSLFLTVPWVGLQFVIEVFPDNTHIPLFLYIRNKNTLNMLYVPQLLNYPLSLRPDFLQKSEITN